MVLLAVADAASDVAGHVGGPDAAGLTRGSLEAAGYALEAATGERSGWTLTCDRITYLIVCSTPAFKGLLRM